jgi:hypothetical protein
VHMSNEWSHKDDLDLTYEDIGRMLDAGTPAVPPRALPGRATFVHSFPTVGTGVVAVNPGVVGARMSVTSAIAH